jgi:hypothetical protein
MTIGVCARAAAFALLASGVLSGAYAQTAGEFYKNRQMRLIVGHAVGNNYDGSRR